MTGASLAIAPVGTARAGTSGNKWLVAVSVGIGAIMATVDSSIVNVAMPHIRGSIGATLEEITWVATAYIIASVLVMPLTGFLGSLFGQKRVYVFCLCVFIAGSMLCGLARSLTSLVLCRALQGLGGGALQPTQQAILRQTFPLEEQGMAMALFAVVIMIGPTVGPTLGGWITDNYSWPWIFYINLPIGLLAVLMVLRFVPEPEDVRQANRVRAEAMRSSMDWLGIALMVVGVATLQYFVEEGPSKDWFADRTITACGFVAAVALAAFVVRELSVPTPAVNLRLFKDRTFLAGTLIGSMQFAMLIGGMFLLPVFMQELLHYDATQSGLTLVPRSLIMIVATPLVGRLYNRVPPAWIVAAGVLLFSLGSWQMASVTLETSALGLIPPMIITGLGFSCLFVALTTAALSRIPRHLLADAAGLNSFFRQIGGSTGLAICVTLLGRFATQARAGLSAQVTLLRPEVAERFAGMRAQLLGRGLDPATTYALATRALDGKVAAQSMVLAFERSFLLQGIAFLFVLPLLFFLRVPRGKAAAGRADAPGAAAPVR